jgi:hypothetical protein
MKKYMYLGLIGIASLSSCEKDTSSTGPNQSGITPTETLLRE